MSDAFSQITSAENETSGATPPDVSVIKFIERSEDVLVVASTVVHCEQSQVYSLCRDLTNLARVIDGVDHIIAIDRRRTLWRGADLSGLAAEWVVEKTHDIENRLVAWTRAGCSLTGSGRIELRGIDPQRTRAVMTALHPRPIQSLASAFSLNSSGPLESTCRSLYRLRQLAEGRPREVAGLMSVRQPFKRRYLKISSTSPWYDRLAMRWRDRVAHVPV